MRIVGMAVFPSFGRCTLSRPPTWAPGPSSLTSVLSTHSGPVTTTLCVTNATCYNFFLLRYRPGTDLTAAAARLTAAADSRWMPAWILLVTSDQRPGDIKNYAGIRDTPLVLGAVLALLAAVTLAHVLLTGVRRRRRDLAVLKTLGLVRWQMLRVVSLGGQRPGSGGAAGRAAAGRPGRPWAWAVFAGSAGVCGVADIPACRWCCSPSRSTLAAGQPHRRRTRLGRGSPSARIRPARRVGQLGYSARRTVVSRSLAIRCPPSPKSSCPAARTRLATASRSAVTGRAGSPARSSSAHTRTRHTGGSHTTLPATHTTSPSTAGDGAVLGQSTMPSGKLPDVNGARISLTLDYAVPCRAGGSKQRSVDTTISSIGIALIIVCNVQSCPYQSFGYDKTDAAERPSMVTYRAGKQAMPLPAPKLLV